MPCMEISFYLSKFVSTSSEQDPMNWKDFLYFRKGSKIGVTLLLTLILMTLALNVLLSYSDSPGITVSQNDSISQAFEQFLTTLKSNEPDLYASHSTRTDRRPDQRESRADYAEANPHDSSSETPSSPSLREATQPTDKKESTPQRSDYPRYPRVVKLAEGETIGLNASDTAAWKKIPGIGDVYSARIVEYRDRLGGFVRKEQLLEIYGIDPDLYARISPYIETDGGCRPVPINQLEFKELLRHPYLNYKQVQAIMNLRRKQGEITTVRELAMLDEFTSEDIFRLEPYLSFQ